MTIEDLRNMGFSEMCLDKMLENTQQLKNHKIKNDINFKPYLINKLYNFILSTYPQTYGTYAILLVDKILVGEFDSSDKFYELIFLMEINPEKLELYKKIMDDLVRIDFINTKLPGIHNVINECLKIDYNAFGGDL